MKKINITLLKEKVTRYIEDQPHDMDDWQLSIYLTGVEAGIDHLHEQGYLMTKEDKHETN